MVLDNLISLQWHSCSNVHNFFACKIFVFFSYFQWPWWWWWWWSIIFFIEIRNYPPIEGHEIEKKPFKIFAKNTRFKSIINIWFDRNQHMCSIWILINKYLMIHHDDFEMFFYFVYGCASTMSKSDIDYSWLAV